MGFSRAEQNILHRVMGACSMLSIVGSALIIFFYVYFSNGRSRSAKLVVWSSITDIVLCTSVITFVLLPDRLETDFISEIFSAILTFQILAGVFWSCTLTKTMALVILQRDKLLGMLSNNIISPQKLAVKRMIKFHVVIWSSATCLTLIPFFFDAYRNYKYSWYWFKTDFRSQLVACCCFFGPLILGTVADDRIPCWLLLLIIACNIPGFAYNFYILTAMGKVKYYFINADIELQNDSLAAELYTLAMSLKNYPIVSMVVSLLLILLQIARMCSRHLESEATLWLHLLSAIIQLSQGILYFLVYLYAAYRNRHRRRMYLHKQDCNRQQQQQQQQQRQQQDQINAVSVHHHIKKSVDSSLCSSGAPPSQSSLNVPINDSIHAASRIRRQPLEENDADVGYYVEVFLDFWWGLLFGKKFHSELCEENHERWEAGKGYRRVGNGEDSLNINAITSNYYDCNNSYMSNGSIFSNDGLYSSKLRHSDDSSQSNDLPNPNPNPNMGSMIGPNDRKVSGEPSVASSRTNSVADNVRLSNIGPEDRLYSVESDQLCRSLLAEFQ